MQQTNQMIHIKVALNNEFRRFSMDKTNYSELVETIRTLYSIPTGTLKICYIDDEADTVLVATDEEFSYAAELIRPLKLVVKHSPTSIPVPQMMPCEVVSTPMDVDTPFPSGRRGRGRGHCGEFKPRCERRNQWKEEKLTLTKEERISRKKTWISEKIQHLEELSQHDLPAHRQRTIGWKLEKLRSKLETLQLIEGVSSAPVEEKTPIVTTSEPENLGRRGCRGRGGRGGCGRGRKAFENHETSENGENRGEKFENPLWHCRKALRAARDSGDQAEIDRCLQVLDEAKTQKWEAKKAEKALNNPHYLLKERKRECLRNLRGANASGDDKRIQECVEALIEAKEALQKAKVASKC